MCGVFSFLTMSKEEDKKIIEELLNEIRDAGLGGVARDLSRALSQQKQDLIKEFRTGKRCLNCGAKKDNNLSDFCSKCIEEL